MKKETLAKYDDDIKIDDCCNDFTVGRIVTISNDDSVMERRNKRYGHLWRIKTFAYYPQKNGGVVRVQSVQHPNFIQEVPLEFVATLPAPIHEEADFDEDQSGLDQNEDE